MTTQHDGRPLSDVAPGVEDDLGRHDGADRRPPLEGENPADEPSPERKVAKNYEEAIERTER
jgi:hypothetical protein